MHPIFFDAGSTLVWLDRPWIVSLLAEHGVETTEEALLSAEYGAKLLLDELVRSGDGGDDASRGRAFFGHVFGEVGVPREVFGAVAERLEARHAESNLWSRVQDGTAEALEALRERGHRLAVISNADGRVEALLESVGLRPHFEFVVDSGVLGVEKPDARIFRHACERMGVEPEEALYVGDIYEIDVVGARGAGMRAMLVDPLDRWGDLDCDRIAGVHELPERLETR